MDIWDKKKRSEVMALVKGKDTKPEIIVRKFLFSCGFRYRKNVKELPGKPDIVLKKYKTVIFIHGCFWHGHSLDGITFHRRIPDSNSEFWEKKINNNLLRDSRNQEELKQIGWRVIIIWECELSSGSKREITLNNLIKILKEK
ncbi:MAG: DNA mismatch endonuclease Vsr [Prevotellaceae bacterium]|jgi:DNA mismatch endonuclease (patch repair protein)|nr:DNA mismatch endonuclease Vsr [Prevotellaceae bacterium]